MAETVFERQEKVGGDASNPDDGVQITFDRLLREYFLGEYPERHSHASFEQTTRRMERERSTSAASLVDTLTGVELTASAGRQIHPDAANALAERGGFIDSRWAGRS